MHCSSCGANVPTGNDVCEYCGTTAVVLASVGAPNRKSIFETIRNSPAYQRRFDASRVARLPKFSSWQKLEQPIGMAMFAGVGGVITIAFMFMVGPLCIVPLLMVIFAAKKFGEHAKKMSRFEASEVFAQPAIVTAKRTHISGGGKDQHARTDYFVTAESETGHRAERQTFDGALYGQVSEGDAGVLYWRGDYAIAFERVTTCRV